MLPERFGRKDLKSKEVKFSNKELELWTVYGFKPYSLKEFHTMKPVMQKYEAAVRMAQTETLMLNSENLFFFESAVIIKTLSEEGHLETALDANEKKVREKVAHMTTYPFNEKGKLKYGILVSTKHVLINSSLELALGLVHEQEHLKNFMLTSEKMGTLSIEKKVKLLADWSKNNNLEEEARGYGKEIAAYIYQRDLTRFSEPGKDAYAKAFILAGSDTSHPLWINIIGRSIGIDANTQIT